MKTSSKEDAGDTPEPLDKLAIKIAETEVSCSDNVDKWTIVRSSRGKSIILLIGACLLVVICLMLALLLWCLKVYPRTIQFFNGTAAQGGRCLPLRVPLCHKYRVPYAYTILPNRFLHEDQTAVSEAISRYDPLVSVKCYSLLPLFLCSLFVPKCFDSGRTVPPCRSLCEETSRKCEFFLRVFSLTWPLELDCSQLPESSDPEVCLGYSERVNLDRYTQACANGFRCDRTRCLPFSWVCDSFRDCQDEADEQNCGHCSPNMFYCGSKKCINKDSVCDGIKDCPDGKDEIKCLRLNRNQGYVGEGRLEAFSVENKAWLPVCGSNWQTETMSIRACRILGYLFVNETRLRDKSLPVENRVAVGTSVDNKRLMKTLFLKNRQECEEDRVYVYLKCHHFECGTTQTTASASWRIVGGQESLPGSWPWLVALHGGPDEVFFCGGVLISQWWVLSAAHCVGDQTDLQGWTVKLGMTRRTAAPLFTERRGLAAIVKHPGFNSVTMYSNDIVMLLLDSSVMFNDYLRPVCLPSSGINLDDMKSCTVIGWGKTLHDDGEPT